MPRVAPCFCMKGYIFWNINTFLAQPAKRKLDNNNTLSEPLRRKIFFSLILIIWSCISTPESDQNPDQNQSRAEWTLWLHFLSGCQMQTIFKLWFSRQFSRPIEDDVYWRLLRWTIEILDPAFERDSKCIFQTPAKGSAITHCICWHTNSIGTLTFQCRAYYSEPLRTVKRATPKPTFSMERLFQASL